MVKHYWQAVHKGVALCRSEKKASETEQMKTSVADGAASGVVIDDAGEGGAFPLRFAPSFKTSTRTRCSCLQNQNGLRLSGVVMPALSSGMRRDGP